jgi:hypothetical protein
MTRPSRLFATASLILAKARQLWLFPLSFIVADFVLAGIVFVIGSLFWLEHPLPAMGMAGMGLIILACHGLAFTYIQRSPRRFSLLAGKIILGNVLAVVAYGLLHGQFDHAVSRATFAGFLAVFAAVQTGLHLWYRRADKATPGLALEPLRWMLLAAAVLVLHRLLLTTGSIGAGDAYWYSIMTADFVSQWRAGVFPVFAGQTEFAFNGAISPLRVAPALQHFAGIVDLVTFHSLPFHGILNLSLLASFAGGAFACYGCLRAIEPRTPWLALVLSLLFSACPGVLALAYVGDLFMSVTTLPFVPLVLYGAWRTLTKGDLKAVLIMVAAAAALWYCHPPIALWATIVAAITQLLRMVRDGGKLQTWRHWLLGVACFGGLSLYCFVSVLTLGIPAYPVYRPVLIENLQNAFPGALLPVSATLIELSDYQLGWTLWAALLAGAVGLAFVRPRLPALALFCAALVLLAFLLPVPWLLKTLWMSVPQVICDITFMWPMQRFYVLLAGLAVFLVIATLGPVSARHRWVGALLLLLSIGGAAWSGREAVRFQQHAARSISLPTQARQQHLPQNRILTRYSFNPFRDTPPYFSHGFIDPQLPNRLLAPGTFAELASNRAGIETGPALGAIQAEGVLTATRPDPTAGILILKPGFRLEPHRHYVLKMAFEHPDFVGGLSFRGERMARLYWLPNSGYDTKTTSPSRAFGALPGQQHSITLWTDRDVPEDINLQFFFTGELPTGEVPVFGRYELREFEPSKLPISVEQWAPYQARVDTPVPAWLETPRMFTDGYRARVNGQEVEVARSPDALVMFPVPAGANRVELAYTGPRLLRVAYFLSLASWLLLCAAWARQKFLTLRLLHSRPG